MKKTILIVASLLTFFSCTKSSNSTNNNNNNTTAVDSNRVTITDNGSTYNESGGGTSSPSALANILCTISKQSTASTLQLYVTGTSYPVQMQLTLNEVGPITGTGVYALADTPTAYSHYYQGTVSETFAGGQTYNIDTTNVTIATASNNMVIGTFRLHLTNAGGNKIITGNINCKKAIVN